MIKRRNPPTGRKNLLSLTLAAFAMLAVAALVGPVAAQEFPSRPIKIVVPYPPGGVIDIMARTLAAPLQQGLGQPIVVENRAGAGGLVGHGAVARAVPDGYTLVIAAAGPVAASLKLYKSMPYDATKDFAAVGMVGDVEVVMLSSALFKPTSVHEVIKYAKDNPGELKFAINSPGSLHHLLTEDLIATAKIQAIRVPYKGAGQAITDLVAGVTNVQIESLPVAAEFIRSKRLNALAVASKQRSTSLPDVPTLEEIGFAGLAASPWYALLAPAGTPKEIVARLNVELNKALADPAVQASFGKQGARTISTSPQETEQFIREETVRWAKVVEQSGVRIDQ